MAIYYSSVVDTGSMFDKLIRKIIKYKPENMGWKEIKSSVDLKTYFNDPSKVGNWVVTDYLNAPTGVTNESLNIEVASLTLNGNSAIYMVMNVNSTTYCRDCSSANNDWFILDGSESGLNIIEFKKTTTAPSDTSAIWVDISSPNNVELKSYNTESGEWESVTNSDYMDISIYDTEGKQSPISEYLASLSGALSEDYKDWIDHILNKSELTHITQEDREKYNTTLLDKEYVTSQVDASEGVTKDLADQNLEAITGVESSAASIQEGKAKVDEHTATTGSNPHITVEKATNWDSKANANHTHSAESNDVIIEGSSIVSGTFPLSQLPTEIVERVYSINNLSELASASITDADRADKYHNGNTICLLAANVGEKDHYFKITDQTKIGTANYMDGIIEFISTENELLWQNIANRPDTVAGYGITDLYSKSEVDDSLDVDTKLATAKNVINDLNTPIEISLSSNFFGDANITHVGIQVARTEEISTNTKYPLSSNNSDIDLVFRDANNHTYRSGYNVETGCLYGFNLNDSTASDNHSATYKSVEMLVEPKAILCENKASNVRAVLLSDDKMFIAYNDDTTGHGNIVLVSDLHVVIDSITLNSAISDINVFRVSDNSAILLYQDSVNNSSIKLNLYRYDTALSQVLSINVNGNPSYYIKAEIIEDTDTTIKILLSYRDNGNNGYGVLQIVTINKETLTYNLGDKFIYNTYRADEVVSLSVLNSRSAIVLYNDLYNDCMVASIVSINGDVITCSETTKIENYKLDCISSSLVGMSKVLIAYKDSNNTGVARLLTVQGSTITVHPKYAINSGEIADISILPISTSVVLIGYRDVSNFNYSTIRVTNLLENDGFGVYDKIIVNPTNGVDLQLCSTVDENKIFLTYSDGANSYKAVIQNIDIDTVTSSFVFAYEFFNMFDCESANITSCANNTNWDTYGLGAAFSLSTNVDYTETLPAYRLGNTEFHMTITDGVITLFIPKKDLYGTFTAAIDTFESLNGTLDKIYGEEDDFTRYHSAETEYIDTDPLPGEVTTLPVGLTIDHTGSPQELITPGVGTGVMMYSLDGVNYSPEIPTGTSSGTYLVHFYSTASNEYERSAVGVVEAEIVSSSPS